MRLKRPSILASKGSWFREKPGRTFDFNFGIRFLTKPATLPSFGVDLCKPFER